MKKLLKGALALFVMAGSLPMIAQDDGARPASKMLQIYVEKVKPGHSAAHEKVELGWPKAYRASKNPASYLAMTSISGPNEAWFISGYDSYEAMEKQSQAEDGDATLTAELSRLSAADGEHLEGARSITARFREDMSLRPALNIGDYRYLMVTTVHIRPGTLGNYTEMRKAIKAAHEQTGMKDYYSVFEVQSGLVGPAFLIMIPMKSLKEVDGFGPMHTSAKYKEALGGTEGDKKMNEWATATVISSESAIFKFSPKMSVAPANYHIGNAEYWNPKPIAVKATKPVQVADKK